MRGVGRGKRSVKVSNSDHLVTPYDDVGRIAPTRLSPLLDRALGAGLHMPVVNRNTGEFYALTTDEAVATEVAGLIAGRAPLLAASAERSPMPVGSPTPRRMPVRRR